MADPVETIELEISPISPDTIDSCKAEILPYIETRLREAGRDNMLSEEHMNIEMEKTFPTDAAIKIVITLLSGMALETYKSIIIPAMKKRFNIKEKPKQKKK